MTPHETRLKELQNLRAKLAKDKYKNRTQLVWIRKEICNIQDYMSAEKREKTIAKKLSMLDSKNADKYFWAKANLSF